jgi:hypothetical protein
MPMTAPGQQEVSPDLRAYDHQRINRLIVEVEKLVGLLEEQRLVEPTKLMELKRELKMIEER